MEILLAFLVGALFAGSIYMILRRCVVKLIIGLALLSHASNLLIFTVGRVMRGKAPIIEQGASQITEAVADPLPQALILTAIVISFGLTAFVIVLIEQVYQVVGVDDVDKLKVTDISN
ncbi:MAG: Na+/H+ antiporter subunit C [Bacteroidales bacterium]|nr:Na+/H+ antiporter subunit C [Bacteroidales bacterium]